MINEILDEDEIVELVDSLDATDEIIEKGAKTDE